MHYYVIIFQSWFVLSSMDAPYHPRTKGCFTLTDIHTDRHRTNRSNLSHTKRRLAREKIRFVQTPSCLYGCFSQCLSVGLSVLFSYWKYSTLSHSELSDVAYKRSAVQGVCVHSGLQILNFCSWIKASIQIKMYRRAVISILRKGILQRNRERRPQRFETNRVWSV